MQRRTPPPRFDEEFLRWFRDATERAQPAPTWRPSSAATAQLDPGTAAPLDPGPPVIASQPAPASSGCASCDTTAGTGLAGLGTVFLVGLRRRR